MDDNQEKLANELKALGSSEEEILKYIISNGIKGCPEVADRCPIANYLTKLGYTYAEVNIEEVYVESLGEDGHKIMIKVDTPSPAGQFIKSFDSWKYEHIIEQ